MNVVEFLMRLNKRGWGVVSFNTYLQDGMYCYFIMVAQKGPSGKFVKKEGIVSDLNNTTFSDILVEID